MLFYRTVDTPLGRMVLTGTGQALTGLWLEGASPFSLPSQARPAPQDPLLCRGADWVRAYFAGHRPDPGTLPLDLGGTPFQRQVWSILRTVPYGQTITYGQMARLLARQQGRPQSARAVGSAVGRNPISILVPCHRVVGADGSLTGYAGGIHRKSKLLQLEGVILSPSPSKIQHICAD